MKLYYAPGACSLSPHIVLREAGLAFDLEKADLKAKKTASGEDFLSVNPKGYVPALRLDDGSVLTEGPVIVQYVGDTTGKGDLVPAAGSMQRYRLQEWLNFITSELHKTAGTLFNPAVSGESREAIVQRLKLRLGVVEKELASKPYLMGNAFSAADAYLFVILRWATPLKVDLASFPNLQAFMARVAARPAVQEALKAEGLLAA